MLWVIVLIVVVLFLVGLVSGADSGPANQGGYTGWH